MELFSKDGVRVSVDIYELKGKDIGRQLTGGTYDGVISSDDGFLVKMSGGWGPAKDRIPVNEILLEAFGVQPISWSTSEFELVTTLVDVSKAVECIRMRIQELDLARNWAELKEAPSEQGKMDTKVEHPCLPFAYRSPHDGRVHYRCLHCSKEYETEGEAKHTECREWLKPYEEPYLYCVSCKEMTVHWISSEGPRCRPCGHINTGL